MYLAVAFVVAVEYSEIVVVVVVDVVVANAEVLRFQGIQQYYQIFPALKKEFQKNIAIRLLFIKMLVFFKSNE